MRHQKIRTRLSRNSSLRRATMRDLAKAVLIRQRICTTKPKAKEARKLIERLITLGKEGTLAAKRRAFAILCDHVLVSQLFSIAGRFNARQGGYTRIIPLGQRRGDNAELAYLELTEKDKVIISKKKTEAQSKSQTKTKPPEGRFEEKKKATVPKTETPPAGHSKKDVVIQEKPKPFPKFLGGLRKMFSRKRPPGS